MPVPPGWPSRPPTGYSCLRFFKLVATTTTFADNAWMFSSMMFNKALPYVAPGSSAPVDLSPGVIGGGQDPHDAVGGVPVPVPVATAGTIRICNDAPAGTGSALEYSFDGVTVHGVLFDGEEFVYRNRHESGISVRSRPATAAPIAARVEAW